MDLAALKPGAAAPGRPVRPVRLAAALTANAALVAAQVVAGVVAHSSGLLADAGHNLTDVAAIGLSLAAARWAARPRSAERSFGNHRGTILAALANASVLAVVTVAVAAFSLVRLVHPVAVAGGTVAAVAAGAVVVNLGVLLVLRDGSGDLNVRANVLHAAGDAASSLCVLVAGVVIMVTGGGGWDRLDPAASLVVALLIVVEALSVSRASVDVLLEATPSDIDLAELRRVMAATPGVDEVHDVHVWSLSSDVRALSAHLVLSGHPSLEEAQAVAGLVREEVRDPFSLAHTTFELECERCDDDGSDPCGMDVLPAVTAPGPHRHGSRA